MQPRRTFLTTTGAAAFAYAASSRLPAAADPQFVVAMLSMLDARGRLDDGMNRDYLRLLADGGVECLFKPFSDTALLDALTSVFPGKQI